VSEDIKAPILSYDDVRRRADEFLARHHSSGTIPVPIEEIVEFDLGMDIVPTLGLHQLLDVDGFITSDVQEIWVDQFVYDSRPGRYRFTLAHEVGHSVLHADIFRSCTFHSVGEWKAFVNSIPEKEHGWLEYQAYAFAGLVLVPRDQLATAVRGCVEKVKAEGIDLHENWDFAWTRIAAFIGKEFEVSSRVIEKRLEKDGLASDIRDQ